jgi:predicted porin
MKKFILVSCMGLAAAGAASAQSNVTTYGMADLGIVREMGGAAGNVTKLSSGAQLGSRLGFKGNEDLGGGLSALFLMEAGMDMSTGASQQGGVLFGRQIYVGLSSSRAGTVTFGRQYSAVNLSLCATDVFGCGLAGAAINLFSAGSKGTATGGSGNARMNNAIKYATPTAGGFNGEISYALGEVAGNAAASKQIDGSVSYIAGPLMLTLAHNRVTDATATTTGKATFLGARYNFGVATVALGTALNKGSYTSLANALQADSRDYLAGVAVPFGPSTFLFNYARKNDRTAANHDANMLAVGYTYTLSKRSNLYTSYGRMKNNARNTAGYAGGFYTIGNALDPGTGDKAFNIGMRHLF